MGRQRASIGRELLLRLHDHHVDLPDAMLIPLPQHDGDDNLRLLVLVAADPAARGARCGVLHMRLLRSPVPLCWHIVEMFLSLSQARLLRAQLPCALQPEHALIVTAGATFCSQPCMSSNADRVAPRVLTKPEARAARSPCGAHLHGGAFGSRGRQRQRPHERTAAERAHVLLELPPRRRRVDIGPRFQLEDLHARTPALTPPKNIS